MSIDPRAAFVYLKMSTEYGFEPLRTLHISRDTYSNLRPPEQTIRPSCQNGTPRTALGQKRARTRG